MHDEELTAAAGAAAVVRRLCELTPWVGDGKALTQTGRIRMADARSLVDRLGTADRIDPQIGDRVFKTRSSQELLGLTLGVEWARAGGLVRRVRNRIVPVQQRLTMLERPVALRRRAYEVRLSLLGVDDPPVWRLLRVSAGITLDRLHGIIQTAMGWQDHHLHQFVVGPARYGVPDPGWAVGGPSDPRRRVRIGYRGTTVMGHRRPGAVLIRASAVTREQPRDSARDT